MKRTSIKSRRLKKLLKSLIDIYSPSGKEEEILQYTCDYLKKQKIPFKTQQVSDTRYNIFVLPSKKKPEVLFLGHLDTVSAFDLGEYEFRQKEDIVSGLGAADMKSGCAAMIEAFTAFRESVGKDFSAALGLVVGEEESADGAIAMLDEYRFPWAIVAEPTGLIPCLGHYGYLEIELSTRGQRRHASYASSHHNAIIKMLKVLLELTKKLGKQRQKFIYNIRDVHSADAGFAVPDRCASSIDLHIPPQVSIKDVKNEIETIMSSLNKEKDNLLEFTTLNSGYCLPDKGLLPGLINKVYEKFKLNYKPAFFRSHSDANLLWDAGIKPIVLGPGELAKAHSDNESVSFSQTLTASKIYFCLLRSLAKI